MMCFPSMLVPAAEQVGIPVPPSDQLDDPDKFRESHPQFFILCASQLNRPMRWGEHWENAKALAKIPVEELKTMTAEELHARGCHCWI